MKNQAILAASSTAKASQGVTPEPSGPLPDIVRPLGPQASVSTTQPVTETPNLAEIPETSSTSIPDTAPTYNRYTSLEKSQPLEAAIVSDSSPEYVPENQQTADNQTEDKPWQDSTQRFAPKPPERELTPFEQAARDTLHKIWN